MRKTFFVIFILFVLVLGFVFFLGKGKLEAPTILDNETTMNQNEESGNMAQTPTQPSNTTLNITAEPTTDETGAKEFIVTGQNFSFLPNVMNVKKGDKVRIIFKNVGGLHNFKIDELNIATKKMQAPYQEIVEFTADKIGSFQYYCSIGSHRAMGMWGTLNVE